MKSWKPRTASFEQLLGRSLALAREAAEAPADAAKRDDPELERAKQLIVQWLSQLNLLYGLPFRYLVADARMLPPESLRWAFVDRNWLAAAGHGALSLGRRSSADALIDLGSQAPLHGRARIDEGRVRARLRGAELPDEVPVDGSVVAMLLRSAVVSGYPGLEVQAFDDGDQPIELLRMDHLASEVLLVLFAELPARVELLEPPEGLHFGVLRNAQGAPVTLLRKLAPEQLGEQLIVDGQAVKATLHWRDGDRRVLDIGASATAIADALRSHAALASELSSAELAIEMVRSAGLQQFKAGLRQGPEEPA